MSGFVLAAPELEDAPSAEVTDLLRGPAGAATRADMMPPVPAWRPPYAAHVTPDGLDDDGEDTGVRLWAPTVVSEMALQSMLERVQEAAVYKDKLHPRWPHDTPGGKGGEFMAVGQTFTSGGKTWQIAHIVNGKVYAHEASANYGAVETKGFDVKQVGGETHVPGAAYVPPTKVPKGGKTGAKLTIVDPYVDPATHDQSIPIPDGSSMSAEQWARFGKVDQEHYVELMGRFGPHKAGHAQKLVDKAYADWQGKVAETVKKGYGSQYGSSSGFSLSLAAGGGGSHGLPDTPETAKLREDCLALQGEHKAAVQWDLYNRTLSPDVIAVHKSQNWSAQQWHDYAIGGDNPVFSGLSQSWNYRPNWWASKGVMTPMAIRHVLMATQSAAVHSSASTFKGEFEITSDSQLKLDKRSLAFTDGGSGPLALSSTEMTWLDSMTNQPQGGHLIEMLLESRKTGTKLPIPPAPPNVVMDSAAGKSWVDPPAAAAKVLDTAKLPKVSSANIEATTLDKSLPWKNVDEHGVPQPTSGEDAGLQAGEFFMGLKGTLYWVGPDPGVGGGYPFRIHKIVDGEFNGENFAYDSTLPGYYLNADFQIPKAREAEELHWNPQEWTTGVDSVFVEDMAVGDKFKVHGVAYEVSGPATTAGIPIIELESAKPGKINGSFKTPLMVPLTGDALPSDGGLKAPSLAIGSEVHTADGHGVIAAVSGDTVDVNITHGGYQVELAKSDVGVWSAPLAPEVGMTFPYLPPGADPSTRVKATVTKITAQGDVQANLKPGKVVIPADEWAAYAGKAFQPGAWSVSTDKVKLRDMVAGTPFQGSAGSQTIRPYEVLAVPPSGPVSVRNMDTGEVTQMSRHVSYRPLEAKPVPGSAAEATADLPDVPVAPAHTPTSTAIPTNIDPANFTASEHKLPVEAWEVGMVLGNAQGPTIVVTGKDADGTLQTTSVKHPDSTLNWAPHEYGILQDAFVYHPKGAPDPTVPDGQPDAQSKPYVQLDGGKFVEGDLVKIGDMAPGTLFKTVSKNKGETFYKLSDDGQNTINLKTGKSYPAKSGWKATVMEPQERVPGGLTTQLAELKQHPGTTFDWQGSPFVVDADQSNAAPGSIIVSSKAPNGSQHVSVPLTGDDETVTVTGYYVDAALDQPSEVPKGEPSLAEKMAAHQGTVKTLDANGHEVTPTLFMPGEKVTVGMGASAPTAEVIGTVTEDGAPWYKLKSDVDGHEFWAPMDSVQGADGEHHDMMPSVAAGQVPVTSLKHKPGALFVYQNQTMSVMADQGASQGDGEGVMAVAPDGEGWYVDATAGVTPLPGKGATQLAGDGDTLVYQGQKVTVTGNLAASLEEGIGGHVKVAFPDGSTGEVPGAMLQSIPGLKVGDKVEAYWPGGGSLGDPKTLTGHVHNMRASDGAVQLTGSILWHKPENVTVLQSYPFKPGDQVQTEGGVVGTMMGWETSASGKSEVAIDVSGGGLPEAWAHPEVVSLASVPAPEPVGVVMQPKGVNGPVLYSAAQPGDLQKLGALKVGDQFSLASSEHGVWQVVDTAPTPQHYPQVATLHEDGQLGTPFDAGISVDHAVVLHAKGTSAPAVTVPAPAFDYAALPDAVDAGLVGYKSHKGSGGKWSHHMIKTMPPGVIFADLGGKQWKVKQAGEQPVITDGEQLFKVNGSLRGKDLGQPAVKQSANLLDTSPSLGETAAAPGPAMVTNVGGLAMVALDPQPGDAFVTQSGAPFVLDTGLEAGWATGTFTHTGATGAWSMHDVPGQVPAHKLVGASVDSPGPQGPAVTITGGDHAGETGVQTGTVGGYAEVATDSGPTTVVHPSYVQPAPDASPQVPPDGNAAPSLHVVAKPISDLQVGETFKASPGSTKLAKVTDKTPGTVHWAAEDGTTGEYASYTGSVVYVEPDAPTVPESPLPGVSQQTVWVPGIGQHPAKPISEFAPGDLLVVNGTTHTIAGVEPSFVDPAGMTTLSFDTGTQHTKPNDTLLAWSAAPEPAPVSQPVDPATVDHIATPEEFGPPADVPVDPIIEPTPQTPPTPESVPGALQPFASHMGPGGVYPHKMLKQLQVGQAFTDKSGEDYKVVDHGDGLTTFEHVPSGKVYAAPGGQRVKATALPPDPGSHLKPLLSSLVASYGSLDEVPVELLNGYHSATGEGGTVKQPRLGHLKFDDAFQDSTGTKGTFLASWLDKALVWLPDGGGVRLVDAGTRIRKIPIAAVA